MNSILIISCLFLIRLAKVTTSWPKRNLPEKVIVGYTTKCSSHVINAVKDGVNVVIWSFIHVSGQRDNQNNLKATIQGGVNLKCVKEYITKIDNIGYSDVIHLVSFGGWNGSHLDTRLSANDIYNAWKEYGGDVFHGIDWDLEGNDDMKSPKNVFDVKCLESMGMISELAKKDGYIVSIAPAESYLDFTTNRFSRYVNLTYPDDNWHQDFSYHGANVYAYLVAKYGDSIDLISIQFYESYTHAAYNINQLGISPVDYLIKIISNLTVEETENDINSTKQGYVVNFENDKSIKINNQFVDIPYEKLVIGLANGWAIDNEKHVFFLPEDLYKVYEILAARKSNPRGFMFWCIDLEGKNGVYLAKGLNRFMKIRKDDVI